MTCTDDVPRKSMLVHPTHVFDGLIVNPETRLFDMLHMFFPCVAEDENISEI